MHGLYADSIWKGLSVLRIFKNIQGWLSHKKALSGTVSFLAAPGQHHKLFISSSDYPAQMAQIATNQQK